MKKSAILSGILLLAAGYFLSGCAIILDGSTSSVTVETKPSRATVVFRGVNGQKMGAGQLLDETFKVNMSTPGTVNLPKNDEYDVLIRMKGYKDVSLSLTRTVGHSFYIYLALDIATTCGIGALIDWVGHGWDRFDPEYIKLNLETAYEGKLKQEYLLCDFFDHSGKLVKQERVQLEKL